MLFASGASSKQELWGQCWSTFTGKSRSHTNEAETPLTFTSKLSTLQSYKPSAAIQPRGRNGRSTAVSTPNSLPLHTSSIDETCFHPLYGGCLWAVPRSQYTSRRWQGCTVREGGHHGSWSHGWVSLIQTLQEVWSLSQEHIPGQNISQASMKQELE